ncbi:4'-phosphopantetheinyl transferase family protein [Aeromonas media]
MPPLSPLTAFLLQRDHLLLPGTPPLPLHRICFDAAAFTPACFAVHDMALPASLQRAAPKRLGEFLAGRRAARAALRPGGRAGKGVAIGRARAPRGGGGMGGGRRALGGWGRELAAGRGTEQGSQLWPGIVDEDEWGRLEGGARALGLDRARGLTLVFSAKESLFKALHPRVGRYFDFLDARWLGMTAQSLTLELKVPLTPTLPAGWRCTLHWQPLPGGVLTSLLL